MKIAIVGSGPSGLYTALLTKENIPDADIYIFDKEAKVGRKMYATGNGKCNILNKNLNKKLFKNGEKFSKAFEVYNFEKLKSVFDRWGLEICCIDEYAYPMSFSAGSVVKFLTQKCQNNGIKIILNTTVFEYAKKGDKYYLNTNNTKFDGFYFDILVMAGGGKSQSKLGSDGSIAHILSLHGYQLNEFKPGLAPIKVKEIEGLSHVNGLRHKAEVSIYDKSNALLFSEKGEVLFKNDGISGIVIFNCESFIVRNNLSACEIRLDLFPDFSVDEILDRFKDSFSKNGFLFLNGWLEQGFIDYILKRLRIKSQQQIAITNLKDMSELLKSLSFTYKESYGFDQSQVSVGGIDIDCLSPSLESIKEPGLFVAGELVDVDGFCGGNNLSWCLISSLLISKKLKEISHR